jgi:hypothetical protein
VTPSRSWTSTLLLWAACGALLPAWPGQGITAPAPVALCSRSAACKAQLKQATDLYQAKRYAEALLAFQGIYARWPEARLLLNIGRTLQKLGHLKEALDYFKRCQEKNLGDTDAQAALQRYIDEVQAQQVQARQAQSPPAAADPAPPKAAPEKAAPDQKDAIPDGTTEVAVLSPKLPPSVTAGAQPEGPSEKPAPDPPPLQIEGTAPAPPPPAVRASAPPALLSTRPPEYASSGVAPAPRKEGRPVYKKWWFWTLVGAGVASVAGAAAGIAVATRPAPTASEAPPLPPNLETYYPMY